MTASHSHPHSFSVTAADGYCLRGQFWRHDTGARPVVVINPATSVKARYYSRFANYLFEHGFDVMTYDYRGIGESRPTTLRGFQASWLDWGYLDFDAVLGWVGDHFSDQPIQVVGHSIGGFVIGLAPNNHRIQRIFTMGAQFAHWRDYARGQRWRMLAKWHLLMPLLTRIFGYFPGEKLGWLEDTPAGVVRDWGGSWARLEDTCRNGRLVVADVDPRGLVQHFTAVTAPTLAVGLMDDPFGTIAAIERLLAYYRSSNTTHIRISPSLVGEREIGHFAFFHSRFERSLWPIALRWLKGGTLPEKLPGVVLDQERRSRTFSAPIHS